MITDRGLEFSEEERNELGVDVAGREAGRQTDQVRDERLLQTPVVARGDNALATQDGRDDVQKRVLMFLSGGARFGQKLQSFR